MDKQGLVTAIQLATCDECEIELGDLVGPCRVATLVDPRHTAIFVVRKMTHHSLLAIGRMFNRDHTTVLYAIRRVEQSDDPKFGLWASNIERKAQNMFQQWHDSSI